MTHLDVGLRCALPNDELCIERCHFEKCNYLSDKADGHVLSGICCASIKSVGPETEPPAHKHGCVDGFPYASVSIQIHIKRRMNTSRLGCVCRLWKDASLLPEKHSVSL